jgi:hypothetical protein
MNRFECELRKTISEKQRMGSTPRGALGGAQTGGAAGVIPGAKIKILSIKPIK